MFVRHRRRAPLHRGTAWGNMRHPGLDRLPLRWLLDVSCLVAHALFVFAASIPAPSVISTTVPLRLSGVFVRSFALRVLAVGGLLATLAACREIDQSTFAQRDSVPTPRPSPGAQAVAPVTKPAPAKPAVGTLGRMGNFVVPSVPADAVRVGGEDGADLGGQIRFLAWRLAPTVAVPGAPLQAEFFFKVTGKLTADWLFFGHVEAPGEQGFQAKFDHTPFDHDPKPSAWPRDVILKSTWRGVFPQGYPGTKARLHVGFWVDRPDKSDHENRLSPTDLKLRDPHGRLYAGEFSVAERKAERKHILIPRAATPPVIDGKLDDPVWAEAARTGAFGSHDGGPAVGPETQARLLWDDRALYIAFEVTDHDIFTSFTDPTADHDKPLWREEAVEVMIDADSSESDYFELQVNAANVRFDKYFHGGPRKGEDMAWRMDFASATQLRGTLNMREDRDEGYTVEIAIPFAGIPPKSAKNLPPKPGDTFRANLFRVDRQGPDLRWWGSMWTPTQAGDYHTLRNWGEFRFEDRTVGGSR